MKTWKKILRCIIALLFIAASLTWCNNTANNENGWSNYKWELTIKWVWPEISMEFTVEEWTLVLRWYFEDHTDHIFLKAWKWENFFESENEYLPWTKVKFEWYVLPLDAAAGNHYYEVVNVESLSFKDYPNEDEVKEILDSYNYCDQDSDCTNFVWHCPFWCFIAVNKNFSGIATNIMNNYFDVNWTYCAYGCMYIDTVKCENFKCHAIAKDVPEWAVFCTIEQKKTETCNMQYDPVCGDDLHTYWNSCTACSSQNIDYYTPWECSTQLIDWDKNSLLDRIYKTKTVKDIRELWEDYDMKQALSDDVIILSAEKNNLAQFFKTTESRWNIKDERLIIYRLAQTTVEWDLVLYDIYFDKNDNLIYLITDFTRDKFSAPEDRVINIRQFENIWTYEHNGIKYGVLYNWEINDEVFQSEDCFVLANLED